MASRRGRDFFVRGAYASSRVERCDAGDATAIIELVTQPDGAIVGSADRTCSAIWLLIWYVGGSR